MSLINKNIRLSVAMCKRFLLSNRCEQKTFSTEGEKTNVSGFAKAFEKFQDIKEEPKEKVEPATFASLLKNSKFIDLGNPEGKIVTGKIIHVVEDDLYIDFGWKFHCICPRPPKNASNYIRGAKVRLLIKDLELSTRFLGYEKDLTLLEADAVLLGLVPEKSQTAVK